MAIYHIVQCSKIPFCISYLKHYRLLTLNDIKNKKVT